MNVLHRTDTRLVLGGVPGGRGWMIALTGFGLVLTGVLAWVAWWLHRERGGLVLPHLPLGVGLLVAQVLLWTGAVTWAVGRRTLLLDRASGTGEYRVRSPIVDAGASCRFRLEQVDSVAIETARESRPGEMGRAGGEALVHRVRLRLERPRRAITLDETENGRLARIEALAECVAGFLGTTAVRVGPDPEEGTRPSGRPGRGGGVR